MPKIVIHAPETSLDAKARQSIAADLTNFALDCESLPKSPFVKSTVWTYFNLYKADELYMGENLATQDIVSMEIFVIRGGLDDEGKKRLIPGATEIIGRQLNNGAELAHVYIVIHEVAEENWGIFGSNPNLAALRASPPDAPAL